MRRAYVFGIASVIWLQGLDAADLPTLAKQTNDSVHSELSAFICNERIERFRARLASNRKDRVDTVTAELSYENGEEVYSHILQNNRPLRSLESLAGAWSLGEYGTLLRQTRNLLSSKAAMFRQLTTINGVDAAIYSFDTNESDTPWILTVAQKDYRVAFRTFVWVSIPSAQIFKIARISRDIDQESRVTNVTWMVTFKACKLKGKQYLVPEGGQYAVTHGLDGWCEWNVVTFSNYHRYEAETRVTFD
jgi:hypothetical protein